MTHKIPFILSGQYFKILTEDSITGTITAECQLCPTKSVIRGKLTVTSNFVTHFKRHHDQLSSQFDLDKKVYENSRKRTHREMQISAQQSVGVSFTKIEDKSLSKFDKLVMQFVVKGMHPLSIVEEKGFRDLFAALNPHVHLISADTLTRKIDIAFRNLQTEIKAILAKVTFVCVTADAWTCKGMSRSFMGVTVHWIDNNLQRRSMALACRRFHGSHTYDRIANLLISIFEEYDLPVAKIVKVVTDNGANFVKAFQEFGAPEGILHETEEEDPIMETLPIENDDTEEDEDLEAINLDEIMDEHGQKALLPGHQRCASHTINLVCTSDVKKMNFKLHSSAFAKCNKMWNKISRSTKFCEEAEKIIGGKLKRPGETRWNSLYDSLKQLMSYKDKLGALCDSFDITKLSLAEQDYLIGYITTVEPLAGALDVLQGENHTHFGTLIPTIFTTQVKLETLKKAPPTHCSGLINALAVGFQKRFGDYLTLLENKKDAIVAAICHPQFKLRWLPFSKREENKEMFISLVAAESKPAEKSMAAALQSVTERRPTNFFVFEDEELSVSQDNAEEQCHESTIRQECLNYLLDTEEGLHMLQKYPNVLAVFKKYNSALPSSAPVERMFSFSGMILNPKRRRLGDSLFEKLTILKYN